VKFVNTKNAETDLLGKLQVYTPNTHQTSIWPPSPVQPSQRMSAATQAEDQLLAQLRASTSPPVQTVVAPQETALTAKASEDALLKALQTTAPTTTIVTVVPGVKADTTTISPLSTGRQPATPSNKYTFSPTQYGTIEVFQNGKLIGTGTASYAAQYGYQAAVVSTPQVASTAVPSPAILTTEPTTTPLQAKPINSAPSAAQAFPQTASTAFGSPKLVSAELPQKETLISSQGAQTATEPSAKAAGQSFTTTVTNGANALTNFYQSNPVAQTLVATLGGAGGAVKDLPGWASALGNAATAASIVQALQQPDKVSTAIQVAQIGAENVTVWAAGRAGGPIGTGIAQGALAAGETTISPWVSTVLYEHNPSFFTPAAQYQPIQINPFTQQPIAPPVAPTQAVAEPVAQSLPPPGQLGRGDYTFSTCAGMAPQ
jgi:hypothetical protein